MAKIYSKITDLIGGTPLLELVNYEKKNGLEVTGVADADLQELIQAGKILSSSDAKKAYTHVTAATMRCVDDVVKTATAIKENCEDISVEAKRINEERKNEELQNKIIEAEALLESVKKK